MLKLDDVVPCTFRVRELNDGRITICGENSKKEGRHEVLFEVKVVAQTDMLTRSLSTQRADELCEILNT